MTRSFLSCLSIFVLLLTTGCGADYLDVNDNPNVATRPPIDGLMAGSSLETATNLQEISNGHAAYFVQYLASPNIRSSTDTYDRVTNGGAWGSLYNTMTDIYDLIRFAEEEGLTRHVAIGKILMAINLGQVVDNWGNAPYSNAFTGETLRPRYDSAEDLYQTIFTLLTEAIDLLPAAADAPEIGSGSDFIYDGDLERWTRAAYSLRARYLNHLSETGQYDAQAVLAAVDNGFTSPDDDAAATAFVNRNPWAQVAVANAGLVLGGWLSEQFIDATNGVTYPTFDPRLPLITNMTVDSAYVGTPNGAGRQGNGAETTEAYLIPTSIVSSDNSPLYIITYAELKFIEAEAALASGDQERANAAFRAGVRASFTQFELGEEDADAYLGEAYGDGDIDRDDIFREKYVALFLNPETWVDARRYDYGYADFTLPQGAALSEFPRRLLYPSTETNRNAENVPDVTMLDAIFWDE
ncbi:SusD/RagB family nutrient-binding outer membrane lipoprotein [Lewinella sp. IMCC34183]|uniref:SusD/RagB family nutrient-binding outer membrane lipoprotein n=1 Tax=Lewinella sp. IMCC34183 TaxID=2248762 RepID=UPI000E25EBE7|nr:SusD/RagB family nutrient-binding outer membrane lipoprotein [Lewinella sp. IMCC34183]